MASACCCSSASLVLMFVRSVLNVFRILSLNECSSRRISIFCCSARETIRLSRATYSSTWRASLSSFSLYPVLWLPCADVEAPTESPQC